MTLRDIYKFPFANDFDFRVAEYDPEVTIRTVFVGTYDQLLDDAHMAVYYDRTIDAIEADGDNRALIILDSGKLFY